MSKDRKLILIFKQLKKKVKEVIFNVVQSNVKGGVEEVFTSYSKILHNSNFKIICLTPQNFPYNDILTKEGIDRININIKGHYDIFATIKLFKLIKKYQPKLIIGHNGRVFSILNILKKIFKVKTKILAVNHSGKSKRLLDFDYIIGIAKHITQNIKKEGFKGEIKTIYNAIKVKKFKRIKKTNKIFTFGVLSRLSPEKNIELILESFSEFLNKVNSNSKLIIAGEGEEKEKLQNITNKLKIADKVEFIGWVDDKNKQDFFNKINVFLQASTQETFGISIIESFNYYCPVISSKAKGPIEIIRHNKTGFLFDVTKKDSLFLEMNKIYKKQDKLEIITKNANQDLVEKFSFETMANSLTKFVKSCISH